MLKRLDRNRRGRQSPAALRASEVSVSPRADVSRREPGSSADLLARLLDAPELARVVPHLAPETLHHLIQQCGLDACAALVAAATPSQLTSILDIDVWRSPQPGDDEQFDADRFGEWLDALVDGGGEGAARIVADLDERLVIAGFSRFIRVFDPATIAPVSPIDDEPIDPEARLTVSYECTVGGYLVRAIRADSWDAIVALLLELSTDHPEFFHGVMRGCRRLSNSTPEIDGLDDLLAEPEQLMYDAALDREGRRSRQGYSTTAEARAFLQMARERRRPVDRASAINPIAAAYFRAGDEAAASVDGDAAPPNASGAAPPPAPARDVESLDALAELFAAAGLVSQSPRALLESVDPRLSQLGTVRWLMQHLRDHDETSYFRRSRELAFLANTLVAGCQIQARAFTPQEASDAAVAACNLGLEYWPAGWPGSDQGRRSTPTIVAAGLPADFLTQHDLVTAFEVGWAALHEDVCMEVTGHLIAALTVYRCADPEIQRGLRTLRLELTRQRKAGTPWQAREALEVMAMLDTPAWAALSGLIAECPVMPEALTAILERRTSAVSATAFVCISTLGQVGVVRDFTARLPEILGR